MKLDRKFLSAFLAVCMLLGLMQGAFAAEISAEYGPATYADIAASTYARMLLYKKGNGVVAAANERGLYGLVDLSGRVIADFQYPGMWVLDGGLFKFSNSADPNWGQTDTSIQQGVIDSNGNVLLPMGPYQINCQNKTVSVFSYYSRETQYYTLDWQPSTASAYWNGSMWYANAYSVNNAQNEFPEGNEDTNDAAPVQDAGVSVYASLDDYDTTNYLTDHGFYYVTQGDTWGIASADGTLLVPLNNGTYTLSGPNLEYYSVVTSSMANMAQTVSYLLMDGTLTNSFEGREVSASVYCRNFVYTTERTHYGLMDAEGNTLLEERFNNIHEGTDGYWHTETSYGGYTIYHGLYSQDGECILEDIYTTITRIADEKYLVCRDGKYGVMAITGTTASEAIPVVFDDYELYGYRFNIFTRGNASTAYTLDGEILMESNDKIDVFASELFGGSSSVWDAYYDLSLSRSYDGYEGNVLPFIIRTSATDSGYATYYVDVRSGESQGYIPYRASNINEDGYFIYQDTNGKYGIGGTNGLPDQIPVNSIPSGVKYVPYSCFLEDHISWGFPVGFSRYELSSGVLPSGLFLNASTGEISGVPMASGTFVFSVKMETDYGEIAEYPMTLFIEDNTNSAVQKPNDYPITDPVGIPDPYDPNHFYKYDYRTEVLRIDGPYYEFMRLLIDGKEKIRDIQYEAHEGSTVITIYGETFEEVGSGTHTIAAEFREDGEVDGTLKTVAQNYTIQLPSTPSKPVTGGDYVPSTSSKPTSKPESKPTTPTPDPEPETPQTSGFPFGDVLPSDWFYDDVKWAYENGMMTGVSETRFAPEDDISQATIVTVLARLAEVDLTAFSEMNDPTIESGMWYSAAAIWAKQSGLLPDYSSFTGEEKIPREQMAIMLVKYMQSLGISTIQPENVVEFPDADQMSSAGNTAFQVLYHDGIFKGVGNNRMDPGGVTSRAQFAALIHRISVFVETN